MAAPLTELHIHFGGCVEPEDALELMGEREVDWSNYEISYRHAHGRPSGLTEILAALRSGDPQAFARFAQRFRFAEQDAGNFDRFLAAFALHGCYSHLLDSRLAEDFTPEARAEGRFVVERIAARCRRQGIAHAEIRIMLGNLMPPRVRHQLYASLLADLRAVSGPDLNLTLAPSLPRDDPWPAWRVIEELALGELGSWLTAVDVCHVEEGHAPCSFRALADDVRRFNGAHPQRALALLYHVGESYRDKSVASAIRWCDEAACDLGAHRLGHAIALGIDPAVHAGEVRRETVAERRDQIAYDLRHRAALADLGLTLDANALVTEDEALRHRPAHEWLELTEPSPADLAARQQHAANRIRSAGAVVETCPTSNLRIAGIPSAVHPIHRFLAMGVPVVVGTDDPGLLGITLADELRWIQMAVGEPTIVDVLRQRAWESRSEVMSGRLRAAPVASVDAPAPT
jgi:hypothetical protein